MNRALDLAISVPMLVALTPAFAVIAVAVKLDDGEPVFFRQERVGKDGRVFRMWKFRTMVIDAESLGPQLTIGRDARITRVGRVLRERKLDELPQILNVIAGEMSLVGPRPELPRYVVEYPEELKAVLGFKPGIVDPASLEFADENERLAAHTDPERAYVREFLPSKLRLSLDYARRASALTDLGVLARCLGIVLKGE